MVIIKTNNELYSYKLVYDVCRYNFKIPYYEKKVITRNDIMILTHLTEECYVYKVRGEKKCTRNFVKPRCRIIFEGFD